VKRGRRARERVEPGGEGERGGEEGTRKRERGYVEVVESMV
jgi:hypothetical protein